MSLTYRFVAPCGLSILLLAACGGAQRPSLPPEERAQRQVQLAASLRDEGQRAAALQHVRAAIKLDGNNARAHLLDGYMAGERGDYARAETAVLKAISLLERAEQASLLAEARNLLGGLYLVEGRTGEAVKVLEASTASPLNASPHLAYSNLGWAYFLSGREASALRALQISVEVEPRFCLGFFRMGRVHAEKQRFTDAEAHFSLALEADPRCKNFFQQAWLDRGTARVHLGRRSLAHADYERCIEISPKSRLGRRCQQALSGLVDAGNTPPVPFTPLRPRAQGLGALVAR